MLYLEQYLEILQTKKHKKIYAIYIDELAQYQNKLLLLQQLCHYKNPIIQLLNGYNKSLQNRNQY